MSKSVQPIPPGHENLIPHLVCNSCSEAIEFYKKAFGAEEMHRVPAPDGRKIMHAAIRIGKSVVFLVDDFPEHCGGKSQSPTALKGTPVTIHHYVENCDAAIKRAQDAGATVTMPISGAPRSISRRISAPSNSSSALCPVPSALSARRGRSALSALPAPSAPVSASRGFRRQAAGCAPLYAGLMKLLSR